MPITMKNFGLTWTDPAGKAWASGVSYDKASAENRQARLVAERCKDVEIIETEPGQVLQPRK
ncbi:hypothetical protein ACH4Y0_34345 [Streptomyces sp. NPDC020707]|uniref:hypothetical protein n=1 Tax=Streptomyces sp. NPDC020707 TaxID=3365084 RepID=UPI0037B6ABC8